MKLFLLRKIFSPKSTIGFLSVDDKFECYTLEDVIRPPDAPKVWGQTAIPPGTYEVIVNFSNRFQRRMPLLLNVPGFDGIRIHPGNTDKDTHGCILVGETKSEDFIGNSRLAFGELFPKLDAALHQGKVFITIN